MPCRAERLDLLVVVEVLAVHGDVERPEALGPVGQAVGHVLHAAAVELAEDDDAVLAAAQVAQEVAHGVGHRPPEVGRASLGVNLLPPLAVRAGHELEARRRAVRTRPSRHDLPWSFSVMTTSSPGRSTSGKLRMFSISV